MQKQITVTCCDPCNVRSDGRLSEVPAVRTETFVYQGKTRKLDLCEEDSQNFDELITASRIEAVRKPRATKRAATRKPAKASKRGAPSRAKKTAAELLKRPLTKEEREKVRSWAQHKAFEVADRGRLPKAVIEAYAASRR